MIDSHAHLISTFVKNIDELILNAKKSEIEAIINSSIEPTHFKEAIRLEEKYKGYIYTTLGFAPQYIKKLDINKALTEIEKFSSIVAVGEVGLDYHWIKEESWREKEKEVFLKFIEYANQENKPLVIHSRKAEQDCIELLEKHSKVPVLMHCFAGTMIQAKRVAEDNNWLISIPTAVVNRKKHRKIAKRINLDNLLVETDTPFLSPIQGKRNQPKYISYAIDEIAKLKELEFREVDQVTTKNAKEFYRL